MPTASYRRALAPRSRAQDQIAASEGHHADAALVVVSDVWLDCARTMGKLEALLAGFNALDRPPAVFVLCGPFLSQCRSAVSVGALRDGIDALQRAVSRSARLIQHSKFVLLPAPADPLSAPVLPRRALPDSLLAPLQQIGVECAMASNPVRLFFFSKEVVVFRDEATVKIRKSLLLAPPLATPPPSQNAMPALLAQAHLSPLPLGQQPRYWEHDHALTLYPAPDVVGAGAGRLTRAAHRGGAEPAEPGAARRLSLRESRLLCHLGLLLCCSLPAPRPRRPLVRHSWPAALTTLCSTV